MTAPENAAVARLEVQVSHLIAARAEDKAERRAMAEKLDKIEAKLDEGAGGLRVLRWFGFGSLASVLAVGAIVYGWFNRQ
jgi:ribosomal protein L9